MFVGDYVDRGPRPKEVIEYVRSLGKRTKAKVVALRGNHEDAWLRVLDRGWPEFSLPAANGCLATLRSYQGGPAPTEGDGPKDDEVSSLLNGDFYPEDVIAWMRDLPFWYEDAHAIYVHAGLPQGPNGFMHPSEVRAPVALLWCRDEAFFRHYRGKLVVFGHTATEYLPPELSSYTPEDPTDLWAGPCTCRPRHRLRQGRVLDRARAPRDEGLRVPLTLSPWAGARRGRPSARGTRRR